MTFRDFKILQLGYITVKTEGLRHLDPIVGFTLTAFAVLALESEVEPTNGRGMKSTESWSIEDSVLASSRRKWLRYWYGGVGVMLIVFVLMLTLSTMIRAGTVHVARM
ncbi:hypothetical protein MRX96_000590 [Rhipicephalus microplus]